MPLPLHFDPIDEARRQWDAHWGSDATPAMVAVTSVMRAHQILIGRLSELLAPWDLTFPRYEALLLLHYSRAGELPLGKMGDRLQVHRASVTNVVDRLVGQGLVERVRHEHDRRTVLARITPEGRRVAKAATEVLNAEQFATAPLTAAGCEQIFELLRPLREHAGDFA
jgi:DNA-binding MarR family transcriptional regulator